RAGGAEDRQALHARLLKPIASAATGNVDVSASMRSRIPPWPGSNALESLSPAPRFIHDSRRSPTMLSAASTSIATTTGAPCAESKMVEIGVGWERATIASTMPYTATPANAPITPSHVLPGLTAGASLCLPKRLPAKYAEMSATQITAATASRSHGLTSRNTTKANQVGHMTIQPAIAHASGAGR